MPPTEKNEPEVWDSSSANKHATLETNETSKQSSDQEPIWIFGYGSLIWKTNFPYTKKLFGFIEGFTRRFWQGSVDHRGVPGNPGRVVTLIPREKEITWGVAYEVLPDSVPEVMAYLNHREKGGYTLHNVEFNPKDKSFINFSVYVYIATESNKQFLGDAPMADIAKQIAKSKGPSGENSEYVLRLAKAVREMGVYDGHLFDLEKLVSEELLNDRLKKVAKASDLKELHTLNKSLIPTDKDSDRQD